MLRPYDYDSSMLRPYDYDSSMLRPYDYDSTSGLSLSEKAERKETRI